MKLRLLLLLSLLSIQDTVKGGFDDDFASFFRPSSPGKSPETGHSGGATASTSSYAEGKGQKVSTQTKTVISTTGTTSRLKTLFGPEEEPAPARPKREYEAPTKPAMQPKQPMRKTEPAETPKAVTTAPAKKSKYSKTSKPSRSRRASRKKKMKTSGKLDMAAMRSRFFSDDDGDGLSETIMVEI